MSTNTSWYIYILECSDKTLYTGVTKNLERRMDEHNSSKLGAKHTRGRGPVKLIYSSRTKNQAEALKEEYRIKGLSKDQKMAIISKHL